MSFISTNISPYIVYLAPPLIGAFIGYLTNRVAIRMLFRPLKPWYLFTLRIPMTPGVIPSKRHDLALNIGEMVGEHLLTSTEVGKALKKKKFQDHLYGLIKGRIGGILERDLGPLSALIPKRFTSYYDIGAKTIAYNIKTSLHSYMDSDEFEDTVRGSIESSFQQFIEHDIDSVIDREGRGESYIILDQSIRKMIASPAMDQWVEDFVYQKVNRVLKKEKSLDDLLPGAFKDLLIQTVESQTPELLKKFADIFKDPDIQKKIIGGVKIGVENFISSLGPMSSMVKNFVSMETIEQKVTEYFKEKEDDISAWLQNEDVQQKISASTLDRLQNILNTPIVNFVNGNKSLNINTFTNTMSQQLLAFLREESSVKTISQMVQDNIEVYIKGGSTNIRTVIQDMFGVESVTKSGKWLSAEGLSLLRTDKTRKTVDFMVDSLLTSLLQKPIGRLSDILPKDVREGFYGSIQKIASAMLATEVPGLVHSLDIRTIVTEKVDSLDLLRLEALLLSIMEEQFKYINLFGALLGFVIGCCNILFIVMA